MRASSTTTECKLKAESEGRRLSQHATVEQMTSIMFAIPWLFHALFRDSLLLTIMSFENREICAIIRQPCTSNNINRKCFKLLPILLINFSDWLQRFHSKAKEKSFAMIL